MFGAVKRRWRNWRGKDADDGTEPCTTEQVLRCEARDIRGATIDESGSALYRKLNGLGLSALCLSGGGIRSAAFALGVLQGLASCRLQSTNENGPTDTPDDDNPLLRLHRRLVVGVTKSADGSGGFRLSQHPFV